MYFNTQEDIITRISRSLEKSLILRKQTIKNIASIVVGMVLSESVKVSKIAENLKEDFCDGLEESKIKKIKRVLNKAISDDMYLFFIEEILKKFKAEDNKVVIIFDHTTCDDRFVILNFMLSIGKRGIPIYYKVYEYKDPNNKSMEDVREGLEKIKELLSPYNYEVTLIADRGFRSIELFEYIDKELGWEYYIRLQGGSLVDIEEDQVIRKLEDIELKKGVAKFFNKVKITEKKYECNIGVKVNEEDGDVWYIATNGDAKKTIRTYKRRFCIEEMFKDMKSNGFNLEGTWSTKLGYFKNLNLCVSIAYVFIITLGSECARNKRNKEMGTFRKTAKAVKRRIYSIFRVGLKWFKKCYFSKKERRLKCEFLLYDL